MQYFTKTDHNTNIPVQLESVSPTGSYFIGWHSASRGIIYLYRKLRETDDAVYGEPIKQCSGSDDVGTGFKGVVWYEECDLTSRIQKTFISPVYPFFV